MCVPGVTLDRDDEDDNDVDVFVMFSTSSSTSESELVLLGSSFIMSSTVVILFPSRVTPCVVYLSHSRILSRNSSTFSGFFTGTLISIRSSSPNRSKPGPPDRFLINSS